MAEENIVAPVDIWGITPKAEESQEETVKAPEEVEEPKGEEPKAPATEEPATEEEGEPDEFGEFFNQVQTLTGDSIEGEFDNTVEGIASYITAAKTKAVEDTFNRIQDQDPRAYAYLVHRANGGSDTDFFQTTGAGNLPTLAQLDSNPVVQEAVLRNYYTSIGVSEKQAELLVRAAKDDENLAESSREILAKQITEEAKRSQDFLQKDAAEKAATAAAIQQTATHIQNVIQKGELNNWIIPANEKAPFLDFLDKRFDFIDGKPYIKVELTNDNLQQELQAQYLAHRKGNLKDLIERQAKTETVQRLRIKAAASTNGKKPTDGPDLRGVKTSKDIW